MFSRSQIATMEEKVEWAIAVLGVDKETATDFFNLIEACHGTINAVMGAATPQCVDRMNGCAVTGSVIPAIGALSYIVGTLEAYNSLAAESADDAHAYRSGMMFIRDQMAIVLNDLNQRLGN